MEDELFGPLYRLIVEEAKRRPRRPRVQFADAIILTVAAWAIVHDRPTCWACQRRHWPRHWHWLGLPSPKTMSQRLPTPGVQLLLEQVLYRVLAASALAGFCLCRRIDSKPLPVGPFSKDRDARRGHLGGGITARGYKLFCCWGRTPATVPEAMVLGPMSLSDPAGAATLIERLDRLHDHAAGGYLLADSTHDTNALHAFAAARGFQLLTPRKQPQTGLGHRQHDPARLRSLALLEPPSVPPAAPGPTLGPTLYRHRGQAERDLGNMGSFGGGLQPLPHFVRRPRRVARWVIVKIILNGLRICRNHRLTP